jgi:hypothetical protein
MHPDYGPDPEGIITATFFRTRHGGIPALPVSHLKRLCRPQGSTWQRSSV